MDDTYKNIEECNRKKKLKILIVFNDMIVNMFSNKKHHLIVTEIFIWGRKLNISLVFIARFYFVVLENIRLNSTHYLSSKLRKNANLNK